MSAQVPAPSSERRRPHAARPACGLSHCNQEVSDPARVAASPPVETAPRIVVRARMHPRMVHAGRLAALLIAQGYIH